MLRFFVSQTIQDIPQQDWERLFGREIIEGWGYHKTIEEARLKGFSLYYLIAKRSDTLTAVFPFFITDFSFATIIQGPLQKLIIKVQRMIPRFLRVKILFVGLPTAEEFYMGIAEEESLEEVLAGALKELHDFARREKAGLILFYNLKELTGRNAILIRHLEERGFSRMENFPNTLLPIRAHSLDEYLEGLSKNTRKDLRRKLRKASSRAPLRTELVEDITPIKDAVYALYAQNFDDSDIHFELLSPDFFVNICRTMPGVAKFFITREQDTVVAFNLCLVKGDTCIDKFIGFDRSRARTHHLYYVTFCHNLAWCIENGIRFYQLGITDYHPKLRLGAELVPLYIYIKLLNPFFNLFAKSVVRLLEPKRFDPTLKGL